MAKPPEEMVFIGVNTPGGPDALTLLRAPVPHPGADEVLIKVHAAEIGRAHV